MTPEPVAITPATHPETTDRATEAVKSIKLPPSRQAGAWTKATEALLEALEREEAEAMVAFESARERVRTARTAANALRQVRSLVVTGQPSTSSRGRITLGPEHPDNGSPARRWSRKFDACRICGTTAIKHISHGRCSRCADYFNRNGNERISNEEQAS